MIKVCLRTLILLSVVTAIAPICGQTSEQISMPEQAAPSIYRGLKSYFSRAYSYANESAIKFRFRHQGKDSGAMMQKIDAKPEPFNSRTVLVDHFLLYELFAMQDEIQPQIPCKPVAIGAACWRDLRLLCGDAGSWHANMLAQVDRSVTSMGTVYLTKLFASPTTDFSLLKRRQELIGLLAGKNEVLSALTKEMVGIQKSSRQLLSLWQHNSKASKALSGLGSFFPGSNLFLQLILPEKTLEKLGNSSTALGIYSVFNAQKTVGNFLGNIGTIGEGCVNVYHGLFGKDKLFGGSWEKFKEGLTDGLWKGGKQMFSQFFGAWPSVYDYYKKVGKPVENAADKMSAGGLALVGAGAGGAVGAAISPEGTRAIGAAAGTFVGAGFGGLAGYVSSEKDVDGVGSKDGDAKKSTIDDKSLAKGFVMIGAGSYMLYSVIKDLRSQYKSLKAAHETLMSIAPLISALQRMDAVAQRELSYLGALCHQESIEALLGSANDGDIAELLQLLASEAFTSESFSIFNLTSVLKAYKLLNKIKEEFAGALVAVGEIDAYCSLACLVKEHWNLPNGYCFPTFEETEKDSLAKPHLAFKNLWDPFIKPVEAVASSMELGGPLVARNALISGPNAGGKSTFMRSSLFAVVMAQTCGIAPAKSMKLTPFTYIDSYVNVEDDPVAKKSLFKAEVSRVTTVLKHIQLVPKDQHSFIVADEMFRGTNPSDASCIARAVCKNVSDKAARSIWIVSSHLPQATEIPKDSSGIFANYHVGVERGSDGKFNCFTYEVLPGRTNEKTAFDVMEQTGMDDYIVKLARSISSTGKVQ
ncbi:hypothetical protein KAU11_02010 [Candidatus Babeliales bacterium]|nr:hypothetical protein [Candidatus Babeliales bacterium]